MILDIDERRREANAKLDPTLKSVHGQFMTPAPIAQFMASLFTTWNLPHIRLLDAGAGIGSLTSAFVQEALAHMPATIAIATTAYEIDPVMIDYLHHTLAVCQQLVINNGMQINTQIINTDFIADGVAQLFMGGEPTQTYTHAIINPPYKKIQTQSTYRQLLRSIQVETVNLYTGFLAVAIKLLAPGGELVAIVPRSFCNGPYYRPFRELLLHTMALQHIHVFESRSHTFKDDAVLQENIIFSAIKGAVPHQVTLSTSYEEDMKHMINRVVPYDQIVRPDDPDQFIHLPLYEDDQYYVDGMKTFPCILADLGIQVSTGPVVDFRLATYLRNEPGNNTIPLIYPAHCQNAYVHWPLIGGKKPNALVDAEPVRKWLYANGYYCVVRRFSSKEEIRRVVATIHNPTTVPGTQIGFENHLNVFHQNRNGLPALLAHGLAVYMNSTLVDVCFRQFNGHTQVNVRDLQQLRYPNLETLLAWGQRVANRPFPDQETIDAWVEKLLPHG